MRFVMVNQGDINMVFGPPDRKTEDGYDGEIIVYTQETVNTVSQSNSFLGVDFFKTTVNSNKYKSTSKEFGIELLHLIQTTTATD